MATFQAYKLSGKHNMVETFDIHKYRLKNKQMIQTQIQIGVRRSRTLLLKHLIRTRNRSSVEVLANPWINADQGNLTSPD